MLSIGLSWCGMWAAGTFASCGVDDGRVKVLSDECVPWPLRKLLSEHVCTNAQKQGWGGLTNGDLIRQAEVEFDLFVTSDQNIRYQQNLTGRRIAILELSTNDLRRIQQAAAILQAAVEEMKAGEFRTLEIP